MSEEAKGLFGEALKLTVLGFVTYQFTPWLETTFPGLPAWVYFTIPAFVAALIVAALWLLPTSKARLTVRWFDSADLAVALSQINVRLNSDGDGMTSYQVAVIRARARGIGRFALHYGARRRVRLRIYVPHTSMTMTPELDPHDPQANRVIPGNDCSVELVLTTPVPDEDRGWGSVLLAFQGLRAIPDQDWTLKHKVVGSRGLAWLCGKLIKVDTKATFLSENWR